MEFRKLKADEIEIRVGTVSAKGCTLLLYKDARCDMNILDESGVLWQRDHKEIKSVMYCGVGIKCGDDWIWKWDAGTESNTESQKGEASDSFKRACVNWGIGRELYTSPMIFHFCETEPMGSKYKLKNNYETSGMRVNKISYENNAISYLEIVDKKGLVVYGFGESEAEKEIDLIDKTMAKTIIDLAKLKNVNTADICKAYKVESIYSLTKDQAGKVKNQLMKKEGK